ncbi:MAG TPA: glycosyltransferase family 4 protein [Vicinamibacterales bacterium]|jgi:glycosyltransferase involved in cell wall biosynthesis|nr:glycosyltransferase family 4 protein [Vicinamibacterales bacterium]
MKLAVVVQRYGAEINGGAELHARYIAEHLAAHADVLVLTTCARDYVSWRNEFPAGPDAVHGIPVERFAVSHERDTRDFGRRSSRVFTTTHSLHEELAWLESEGPACPSLVTRLARSGDEFDFVILFSARYYHAYHGARGLPHKAILVPTAEREAAIALSLFGPIFRGVRAVMYNSFEERAMIGRLTHNEDVPGVVVGIGSEVPATASGERARQTFGFDRPYLVYVGRIDANKGCAELFEYFLNYVDRSGRTLDLVLIGAPVMKIPDHPRVHHLGFVSDTDKFDTIAGAEALVMPSYFESLSMVALEAWALGRPVLANARCDVLVGQSRRSNAGLYYANAAEFRAAVDVLLDNRALAGTMGDNGRAYYAANYAWPVIEQKYLDMFDRLRSEPPRRTMEALPGFFARRARTLPPAADVLTTVPSGPVLTDNGLPT